MLVFSLIAVAVFLALSALYVIKNLNIWDGVLGMSIAMTLTVIGLALYSAFNENPIFLDIAIAFALLGFVGTLFVAVFIYTRGDL